MKAYIVVTERMTGSPIYNFGRASHEVTGKFIFFPQGAGVDGMKKGLFIQIESKEDIGRTFQLAFLPRVFESWLLFSEEGMKSLKVIRIEKGLYDLAKKILSQKIKLAELLGNNSALSKEGGNPERFMRAVKQEENDYRYNQIIESGKKQD
ncbi:MAG TPA: hypothetical protein DIT25_03825 [Candidatus Moranbacteria bacterium]|nr:hypothetical protein [Candidatus Moranbacteria bacterium]